MKKILVIMGLVLTLVASVNAKNFNVLTDLSSVGAEVGITDRISLAGYMKVFSKSSGALLKTHYYFDEVFDDSLFVGVYAGYSNANASITYDGTTYDLAGDYTLAGVNVGYRWMWESINITIDIGYGYAGGTGFDKQVDYLSDVYQKVGVDISRDTIKTLLTVYSSLYLGFSF